MAGNQFIAVAQKRLDECRRQLRDAASDLSVADETVLELRKAARHAYDELKQFEEKAQRKGFLSFLGL